MAIRFKIPAKRYQTASTLILFFWGATPKLCYPPPQDGLQIKFFSCESLDGPTV